MTAARDQGLQPERTALAWQRTALAAALLGALLLRSGWTRGAPLETIAGSCAAGLVVISTLARLPSRNTRASRRRLVLATAAAVLAGLFTVAQSVIPS